MYYIRHYVCFASNTHLVEFLKDNFGILCLTVRSNPTNTRFSYSFEVPENHPRFTDLEPYLPEPSPPGFDSLTDPNADITLLNYIPQYSNQELQSAKWLVVRSSFSKVYPENASDLSKSFCLSRVTKNGLTIMRHCHILGNYIVKKPVKWGKRFFAAALPGGEHEVFCNLEARNVMERAGLRGVEYEEVRKSGTGVAEENLYYLKAQNTLVNGAIVPISDMDTYTCDQCGMHMLGYRNTRGQFGIRANLIDDSVDFYRTLPLFSPTVTDPSLIEGSSRFIVSRRFYQLVKELKMDRALWFEPISLV